MEMTSTGAFIALVDGINQMVIPIADINLDEVDYHLDPQEKEAQERYDEMAQGVDKNDVRDLPEGWNLENRKENYTFTEGQDSIPEGWKVKAGKQGGKTVPNPVNETRRLETHST